MHKPLRFAVLGDTHFCWKKHHPEVWRPDGLLSRVPDYLRYLEMRKTCGIPLLKKIAALQPEFLISTGDIVEGGLQDHPDWARDELLEGWNLLQQAGVPVLIAKGTHEGGGTTPGGEFYRKELLPRMAGGADSGFSHEYFRFEIRDCVFLILDYLEFKPGGPQESWLIRELEAASGKAGHIFLVAHPPLFLWGRHFFDTPVFTARIEKLCRNYPVDAYFCGHTHNQCISFHRTENNGNGFLQLTGSAVGYPHLPVLSLDTFHRIADYGGDHQFTWGILEDSAPGFFMLEIDGEKSRIEWHSLQDSALLTVPGRRMPPSVSKKPGFAGVEHGLAAGDVQQIQSAWLHLFSVIQDNSATEICINGIPAGKIPDNRSYAARRFVSLAENVVASLGSCNLLELSMPRSGSFAIGSISLEVLLYDRRRLHSFVADDNLVCGPDWQEYRCPERFRRVSPGETVPVKLLFDAI